MNRLRTWLKQLFFNRAYLGSPPWESGVTPPELVEFASTRPPGNALDVGCGSGLNLLYLARAGWQVQGVDFSFLAIRKARRRFRQAGRSASLIVGSAAHLLELPLNSPFDLVLDIGCLHGLGSEAAARAYAGGVIDILNPGGEFLLYAHESAEPEGAYPARGINAGWVYRLFTPALEMVEYRPGLERTWKSAWYRLQKPVHTNLHRTVP